MRRAYWKKLVCMLLVFAALFKITACGNGKEGQNSNQEQTINQEQNISREPESGAASDRDGQKEALSAAPSGEDNQQEAAKMKMKIQVGDTVFTAALAENSSVEALKELMAEGPLTLDMHDFAGMEKGVDLGITLPQNNEQMHTQAGDIILYQGRTLAIYYSTNSWSLTPIGKIDLADEKELRNALGTGDVTVILSLE